MWRATAAALRRQPATSGRPLLTAACAIDEPFGEGSTSRVSGPRSSRLAGDSVGPSCDERLPASTAPIWRASSTAFSPPVCGHTFTPRSTATVTEVEKDSTSTTTMTSHCSARTLAPIGPHSSSTDMCARVSAPGPSVGSFRELEPPLLQRRTLGLQGTKRGVQLEDALVVGGRRGHLLVQPGLTVTQLVQRPVDAGELLARGPGRRRVRRADGFATRGRAACGCATRGRATGAHATRGRARDALRRRPL